MKSTIQQRRKLKRSCLYPLKMLQMNFFPLCFYLSLHTSVFQSFSFFHNFIVSISGTYPLGYFKILSDSDSFFNPLKSEIRADWCEKSLSIRPKCSHLVYQRHARMNIRQKKVLKSSEGNKHQLFPQVTAVHQTAHLAWSNLGGT